MDIGSQDDFIMLLGKRIEQLVKVESVVPFLICREVDDLVAVAHNTFTADIGEWDDFGKESRKKHTVIANSLVLDVCWSVKPRYAYSESLLTLASLLCISGWGPLCGIDFWWDKLDDTAY